MYLDDYNGSAGLDAVAPPVDVPLLAFDPAQMRQLGLVPAASDSRLVSHASIAAATLRDVGLDVADAKTLVGPSIISLGLRPDAARFSITCPDAKRRILSTQCARARADVFAGRGADRDGASRLTGRLCDISRLFPELAAELHGGYRVGGARERSGARRLLTHVPLVASSPAGAEYDRMAAVAIDVLAENAGIPLAVASSFPAPGSPGLAVVVGDASGDIAGGDAGLGGVTYLPDAPGVAFVTSAAWPDDIAAALAQSALQPHLRSGAPRLSMPAAELFTSWACLAAALDASGLRERTRAAIAVGDCQPAAAALNRASSPVAQLRALLASARAEVQQWLGVQVPRELNTVADLLSHPSRFHEACAAVAGSGVTPVSAPLPPAHPAWAALRAAIAASLPSDSDF